MLNQRTGHQTHQTTAQLDNYYRFTILNLFHLLKGSIKIFIHAMVSAIQMKHAYFELHITWGHCGNTYESTQFIFIYVLLFSDDQQF